MTDTNAPTTHPYDSANRLPDGNTSEQIDWREALGEDMDGWRSAEIETVEHEGETFRVIAGATGQIESVQTADGFWIPAYEAEDEDGPLSDMLRETYGEIDSAEGPMMNSWYRLESDGYGSRDVDITVWARELDGLPLAAVHVEGQGYGLALTGGGMDLSWEIAEGHLRLGYLPPSWIDLPAMADSRRSGETLSDDQRAIVRAVVRRQRGEAMRAQWAIDRLVKQYGDAVSERDGESER